MSVTSKHSWRCTVYLNWCKLFGRLSVSHVAVSYMALIGMLLVGGYSQADEESALKALKALKARYKQDHQREGMPVVRLSLQGPQINDDLMATVIELNKLQSLSISNASISGAGLKRLAALADLTSLSLNGCKLTDNDFEELSNFTRLESLDLRKTSAFTSEQIEPMRLPALKRLRISSDNKLDLSLLAELQTLEELTMVGNTFPTRSTDLSPLERLNNLTVLRQIYLPEAALEGIEDLTTLREVELTGTGWLLAKSGHVLTEKGILKLKSLANLRTLVLTGRQISPEGFELLGQLTQLQHLNLKGSNISDDELTHLQHIKSLTNLELDGTNVSEKGVADLRLSLPEANIVFHVPKETEASREAKKAMSKLRPIYSIAIRGDTFQEAVSYVGLRRSRVRDDDLKHLQAFSELSNLDLSETDITDRGIEHLLTLQQLSTLKLSHTLVTDTGIQQLSKLSSLMTLELNGLPITEAGLEKLKELKKLRKLTISGSEVSAESINELKTALPELELKEE